MPNYIKGSPGQWNNLERNLKVLRYRFSNIHTGEIRKVGVRPAYGYAKLAKLFKRDKATIIDICKKRADWIKKLKEMSKAYLKPGKVNC